LPAEVAETALHNKTTVYDSLSRDSQFHVVSETMSTIADDLQHLGARIGITAVPHTQGSALAHHHDPTIMGNMIVPGIIWLTRQRSDVSIRRPAGWSWFPLAGNGGRSDPVLRALFEPVPVGGEVRQLQRYAQLPMLCGHASGQRSTSG
jgi:hypothetical protein